MPEGPPNPSGIIGKVIMKDGILTLSGILGIVLIICFCVCHGIDHTLVKVAIAAIAGLAGFSARGISKHR